MKIAFAVRDRKDFVGGPAVDAARLLPALQNLGHEVHAICFWVGSEKVHDQIDILIAAGIPCRVQRRQRYTEDGVKWILEQLAEIHPDVFVAGLSTEGCFTSRWLREAGVPVVNILFGNDPVNLGRSKYFSDCDPQWRVSGHAVFGQTLADQLLTMTRHRLPYTVVHGIAPGAESISDQVSDDTLRVVYSGRLVEIQKRTGDLLHAFVRICQNLPYVRLDLYGDSVDGERAMYESIVREVGMESRIRFFGILSGSEYYRALSGYHVIVLLSDTEGLPGALVDGMSAGLVPVCLRYQGVEDLISDGENGVIVEDRTDDLQSALRRMYEDASLRKTLASGARSTWENHFTPGSLLRRWESFLSALIEAGGEKQTLRIPGKIKLPKHDPLLLEDRRKPSLVKRLLSKVTWTILALYLLLGSGCTRQQVSVSTDRDPAIEHLKKKYVARPFSSYYLNKVPPASECLAMLDDQGRFVDAIGDEQLFVRHLDSVHTDEHASVQYSEFLVTMLLRLWKIAETFRNRAIQNDADPVLLKLSRGIIHYGSLELARPGNKFRHKYSDFQVPACAINMYFCLYKWMEPARISEVNKHALQHQVYKTLTALGLQAWTIPAKEDSTDQNPFQVARFHGHTWWINGNALEFRPTYPAALMMHSPEMLEVISQLADRAVSTIGYASRDTAFWHEGITVEGTSWTYGKQHRMWSYPYRGVRAALELMSALRGTPWEISMTRQKMDILMTMLRTSSFYYYKGYIPPCQDRQGFNYNGQNAVRIPSVSIVRLLLTNYSEWLSPEEKSELKQWRDEEPPMNDERYSGTRYFYCVEDMVRKTPEYYVIVNMASRRVDGVESAVHLADAFNFFKADGATMFMRTGNEYFSVAGAFEITSHPGVTARHGDGPLIAGRNLMGHCSQHNFAAGVSTNAGACAGFVFEKMRGLDKYHHYPDSLVENDQEWIYGVKACKSFFWFGDHLVMLGAGIRNLKPELGGEIRTTIDQTLVRDPVVANIVMDTSRDTVWMLKPPNAPHEAEVVIKNNGFTYSILPEQTPGAVYVQKQRRPTRWDMLNMLNRDITGKTEYADIFQIWIDHGAGPRDDRYGYMVYCGIDPEPQKPRVIRNTQDMQAMVSADGNVLQAILYRPDTLSYRNFDFVLSAPCAINVALTPQSIAFAVSDALADPALQTISITTNMALVGADQTAHGWSVVTFDMPAGDLAGSQVNRVLERH